MRNYNTSKEYRDKEREVNAIRNDIFMARGIITDGMQRYKKKKLHARNKKQTEDLSVFAALAEYASKREIHDAYGWDVITEMEMERLNALWDAREQYINEQGKFQDRVTDMLARAIENCGEEYSDVIQNFNAMERRLKDDLARIERENRDNTYKQRVAER